MRLFPTIRKGAAPLLEQGLRTIGIELGECDTPWQYGVWVPAKYDAYGALNAERKNAHDLAFLAVMQKIKTLWQPQAQYSPLLPERIADSLTRVGGQGCFVMLWGDFTENKDENKVPSLWGVLLLADNWQPLDSFVCKSASHKSNDQRAMAMLWLPDYFKNRLGADHASAERNELTDLTERLLAMGIQPKSFRLVSKQVTDPVPSELLADDIYQSAPELGDALLAYRQRKPSLLKKIAPAIFVSPDDFKRLQRAGVKPVLVGIRS